MPQFYTLSWGHKTSYTILALSYDNCHQNMLTVFRMLSLNCHRT